MSDREEKKRNLREKSKKAAQLADAELTEEWEKVKKLTAINLESLKPKVADEERYQELVKAVEKSIRRNESLAEFKGRLKALWKGAESLAKDIIDLAKG